MAENQRVSEVITPTALAATKTPLITAHFVEGNTQET